jgi:hypothetical protein
MKFHKLVLILTCLVLLALVLPVRSDSCPGAFQIAENTQCVQDQVQPLRDSGQYNEHHTVTVNGDGTATVTYTFDPKCLNSNPPCGLSSKIVTATVNCSTGTATCP